MNLPIFNIEIDEKDSTGCYTISLVEQPAVEVDFLKFDKDEPIQLQLNEEKHIINGVAIRADFPIYRNSREYGEHYVVFTKDVIKQIIEKYSKLGFNNLVNIEHNSTDYVDDITMVESYLIDREKGINPSNFSKIEDGSWITSFKVNDMDLWERIKNGEVKGFSIEGFFYYSNPVKEDEFSKVETITYYDEQDTFESFIDELIED